jgi:hypothetical protein
MVTGPPIDDVNDHDLTVGPPKTYAAGVPAVIQSLHHAGRQMGARRSLLTLVDVNQKRGFECPGCAWPEGDHRNAAEFCENGAKAVAEEATLRRVGPEFFARHTVTDLARRSDYWLGQQGRYQLFVRALGTNNLPDCSNRSHESSSSALTETIGLGKGSVSLDDLYQADLIFGAACGIDGGITA